MKYELPASACSLIINVTIKIIMNLHLKATILMYMTVVN